MDVKLISYPRDAEFICALAMRNCHTDDILAEPFDKPKIEKLLKAAINMGHFSIFEHASFTFLITDISRVTTHQLVRHRIASYSQQSHRYTKVTDFVIPDSIKENKQASRVVADAALTVKRAYDKLLSMGIKKEDARYIMPQGAMSNIVVTMNARSLRHFLKLRLDKHAQWEIQSVAEKMLDCVGDVAPLLFQDLFKRR